MPISFILPAMLACSNALASSAVNPRIEFRVAISEDEQGRQWLVVDAENKGRETIVIASPTYGSALFAQAIANRERTWLPLVEGMHHSAYETLEPGSVVTGRSPASFFLRHDKGHGIKLKYDDREANEWAKSYGYPRSSAGSRVLGKLIWGADGKAVWIERPKAAPRNSWPYPNIFGQTQAPTTP